MDKFDEAIEIMDKTILDLEDINDRIKTFLSNFENKSLEEENIKRLN